MIHVGVSEQNFQLFKMYILQFFLTLHFVLFNTEDGGSN